jgi:hypothetical protein
MLAPKQEERQSLIPQADNEKSAKRNHGSSDDSDAGNDKPDAQRMKGEHGAVARGNSKRSNRWGTAGSSSGKEEFQSLAVAAAFSGADEFAADQQQLTSRRGVSKNLRGTHDPVLGFAGRVRSLDLIRKDVFRSADSLRLPKGQESRVFHRENFLDQNAVIRSASQRVCGFHHRGRMQARDPRRAERNYLRQRSAQVRWDP